MNSQNTSGDATTPITRLFCRQKRTSSRCHSVAAGKMKLLNSRTRLFHEDILEAWLMQAHRFDGARKRLHHVRDKPVPVLDLHSHLAIERHSVHTEALRDFLRQYLRVII